MGFLCGRYLVITEDEIIEMRSILEELNQRFAEADGFSVESPAASGMEVVPSLVTPVLVDGPDRCLLKPMRWGFPRWDGSGSVINARAESVGQKPFFRESFLHSRCIVPSRGFFEWKRESSAPLLELAAHSSGVSPSAPQPGKYWIRRADSPLFFMAGIYQKGRDFEEFVILTMPANLQLAPIHDRMPVFLDPPQLVPWLRDPAVLQALLQNRTSSVPFLFSKAGTGERTVS